jgi:hypothetical protein
MCPLWDHSFHLFYFLTTNDIIYRRRVLEFLNNEHPHDLMAKKKIEITHTLLPGTCPLIQQCTDTLPAVLLHSSFTGALAHPGAVRPRLDT